MGGKREAIFVEEIFFDRSYQQCISSALTDEYVIVSNEIDEEITVLNRLNLNEDDRLLFKYGDERWQNAGFLNQQMNMVKPSEQLASFMGDNDKHLVLAVQNTNTDEVKLSVYDRKTLEHVSDIADIKGSLNQAQPLEDIHLVGVVLGKELLAAVFRLANNEEHVLLAIYSLDHFYFVGQVLMDLGFEMDSQIQTYRLSIDCLDFVADCHLMIGSSLMNGQNKAQVFKLKFHDVQQLMMNSAAGLEMQAIADVTIDLSGIPDSSMLFTSNNQDRFYFPHEESTGETDSNTFEMTCFELEEDVRSLIHKG